MNAVAIPQLESLSFLSRFQLDEIYSRVVRASNSQCRSRICPGFDPSILRHSGIWGAADEAVTLTIKRKNLKKSLKKIRTAPQMKKHPLNRPCSFAVNICYEVTVLIISVYVDDGFIPVYSTLVVNKISIPFVNMQEWEKFKAPVCAYTERVRFLTLHAPQGGFSYWAPKQ